MTAQSPLARPSFDGVLACTVRGCGAPLTRDVSAWRCPAGHVFDVARRGYVNLLQPQDRRSREAGDTAEAVAARARLIARGIGVALFDALAAVARGLALPRGAVVVELGSGTGDLLRRLTAEGGLGGVGVDLSTAAADHAAREAAAAPAADGACQWVVANADRRLPLVDGVAALVLAVHGRRNPAEVARVLAPGGHWLVAVPGADDLCEVRAAARGGSPEGVPGQALGGGGRERLDALAAELAAATPFLAVVARGSARARVALDAAALADLCAGTYRAQRRSEAERLKALAALEVTLHSDWLLAVRSTAGAPAG